MFLAFFLIATFLSPTHIIVPTVKSEDLTESREFSRSFANGSRISYKDLLFAPFGTPIPTLQLLELAYPHIVLPGLKSSTKNVSTKLSTTKKIVKPVPLPSLSKKEASILREELSKFSKKRGGPPSPRVPVLRSPLKGCKKPSNVDKNKRERNPGNPKGGSRKSFYANLIQKLLRPKKKRPDHSNSKTTSISQPMSAAMASSGWGWGKGWGGGGGGHGKGDGLLSLLLAGLTLLSLGGFLLNLLLNLASLLGYGLATATSTYPVTVTSTSTATGPTITTTSTSTGATGVPIISPAPALPPVAYLTYPTFSSLSGTGLGPLSGKGVGGLSTANVVQPLAAAGRTIDSMVGKVKNNTATNGNGTGWGNQTDTGGWGWKKGPPDSGGGWKGWGWKGGWKKGHSSSGWGWKGPPPGWGWKGSGGGWGWGWHGSGWGWKERAENKAKLKGHVKLIKKPGWGWKATTTTVAPLIRLPPLQSVIPLLQSLIGVRRNATYERKSRPKREEFKPYVDPLTSLEIFAKSVLNSIKSASNEYECIEKIHCENNKQAQVVGQWMQYFMPIYSFTLSFFGHQSGAHESLLDHIRAIVLGATETNCRTHFPRCEVGRE